ncbi:sensor histidine kinase, partial [Shimia sp.]|uniref:sensor histidine kinase n=1 Tax=Shimia sp. TaxID=1954381 RepID=UPI00356AE94F
RDYISGGMSLVWQRHATFFAAMVLSASYFDLATAMSWYVVVLVSELFDTYLSRHIIRQENWSLEDGRRYMLMLVSSTLFSSFAICGFIIAVATNAGPTAYFTPLFFLFAAGIFAAMNNHQLLPALMLRLVMYGLSFLYIPLHDILADWPPIQDILWLQLFTSLFVMYFVVDCSRIFLKLYRHNLNQMKALQKEHQLTKVAFKAKTEFLATISHELRTPLTSITGSLGLISSGALDKAPEKRASVLKIANDNCDRLSILIEEILSLQTLESDEVGFNFEPLPLAEFLPEVAELMRAQSAKANITLDLAPIEDGLVVSADQDRLLELMKNLLTNAVNFSAPDTRVTISARKSGDTAVISVADQGIGIPEADRERIFEKFTQLASSDHREVGGTGLGLNIARQIAEKHRGRLECDSTLGEGSTFTLTLPLAAEREKPAPASRRAPQESTRARGRMRRKTG